MPWFKIDDNFYDHPKVDDLPLAAVGLWSLAGAWCAKQLTDGHITETRVRKLGGTNAEVTALVTSGLWVSDGEGWVFKNWHEYQPTRESVEAEREKSRRRQQAWKARKRADAELTSGNTPDEGHQGNDVSNGVTNGVATGAPTRPDPTRPTNSSPASRRKPKRAIPGDWEPVDRHRQKAQERQLDISREATAFKNHAQSVDRRLSDWDRGFDNWLLNARPMKREYNPLDRSSYG